MIRQIGAVIHQQIERGSPITVLHLTEDDWLAVKTHKDRFPAVAAASGGPTADDERPRYLQFPVSRSLREFSYAEFLEAKDGRVTPSWVRLDTPNVTVHQSNSILGGESYLDAEELSRNNLFRAGMALATRSGVTEPSLLGKELDGAGQPSVVMMQATAQSGPKAEGGYGRGAYGQGPYGGGSRPQADPAPKFPTSTPDYDEQRDTVGNVLTDSESEVITDSEGIRIETVAEVNLTVPAFVRLGGEVIRRSFPAIPAAQPAALDFTVTGGRIAVVADAASIDADVAMVSAMFSMVQTAADELASTLKATNVDGRLVARLERIRDTAAARAQSLEVVFRLGHEADVLRIYLDRADPNELGPHDAATISALARRLDECAAQYPAWRAFKRNASAAELTREQITAAPVVANALIAEMEATDGSEVVDSGVPNAFKALVATLDIISTPDDPNGVINDGCDLLAQDLIENVSNFIKIATSVAADLYGLRYVKGFKRRWGDLSEEDGEKTAIWLHRALGVMVVGSGITLFQALAANFPLAFRPLSEAWGFIQEWAPFVAQGLR